MKPESVPSKQGVLAFIMGDKLWHLNRSEGEFNPDDPQGGFQRLWKAMHTCPAINTIVDAHGRRTDAQ
jgi:hypothetical protein